MVTKILDRFIMCASSSRSSLSCSGGSSETDDLNFARPPPDYIYTADKLQRTARWLENMEGGIEKLKKVIIEDELGICGALEKAMSDLIGTYECEWTRQSFPLPSPRSRCGGR